MSPKMKPLIAVVQEDRGLAATLAQQLESHGFATQTFHKAATAKKFVEDSFVHCVVIDPALSDSTGLQLLENLRASGNTTAILFLATPAEPIVIAQTLDAGADDFIIKPYHLEELVARINAVLRRSETAGDRRLTRNVDLTIGTFSFNGAEVHPERLELIFHGNRKCKLGRKELGILYHLHANPGVIISRQSLIHAVWGVHANVRSRSLDQYVAKIRDYYEDHGQALDCLRTIHGIGYWYEPEAITVTLSAPAKKSRRS